MFVNTKLSYCQVCLSFQKFEYYIELNKFEYIFVDLLLCTSYIHRYYITKSKIFRILSISVFFYINIHIYNYITDYRKFSHTNKIWRMLRKKISNRKTK